MNLNQFKGASPLKQRGALTIFSAILILFLMTVAMLYSTRNALFDQRSSSNEERYRKAFIVAEGAMDVMTEYLVAESSTVISDTGWLNTTNGNWTVCPTDGSIPLCATDFTVTAGAPGWYIENVGATDPAIQNAINSVALTQPDTAARVSVALQFVSAGAGSTQGATGSQAVFMIYGYGYSDCSTANDIGTCQGSANVAKPLATFRALSSPPDVPFTSKAFVASNGGWTVVANPDAGGAGVPVSMWLNGGASENGDDGLNRGGGQGTWQTCQYDEWYETAVEPPFAACPGSADANGVRTSGNHSCACTGDENLSSGQGSTLTQDIDLLVDYSFPADLFQTYFGVPRAQYDTIKGAATVVADCSGLDENSAGLIWVEGVCSANNQQIGGYDNPVVLVGAGGFAIQGQFTTYGVLYCFDGEVPGAEFSSNANAIVYGAIVVDCAIGTTNGTFDLVYNAGIVDDANGIAGVGAADGGWRDFNIPAYGGS